MPWPRPLPVLLLLALPHCGSSSPSSVTPPGAEATPPTCTLTSPAPFSTGLTGAVVLTAEASDASGLDRVIFRLDGSVLAEATAPPYTFTLPDTAAYASGQHVVQALAVDRFGNQSPVQTAVVSFGGTVAKPSGFTLTALPGTLTSATALTAAPDGRLFICEQGGALRIHKAGALLPTPFATLPTSLNGERGLIGVALDPAFSSNGHVYVHYTALTPAPHNRISRLTADPANPDQALPGSEVALVDLPNLSSATNHNGGPLRFGPDGMLYVGVGDNANGANAPDLASPLGKLLRFRADGTIPPDNPFYGTTTGLARAIWAKGLRNPFSFAFQASGRLHLNDVGQSTWEEVNLILPGRDYGWPGTEGPTALSGIEPPLFAYGHPSLPTGQPGSTGTFLQGVSIVGAVFLPTVSPWPAAYQGDYVFADYTGGWVARWKAYTGEVSTLARPGGSLVDLALAPDGALLVLGRTGLQRLAPP